MDIPPLTSSILLTIFPFTDTAYTVTETGQRDGLLGGVKDAPRIFYTNGSYEYWGRNAALVTLRPDGKQDAELAPQTRIYLWREASMAPAVTSVEDRKLKLRQYERLPAALPRVAAGDGCVDP